MNYRRCFIIKSLTKYIFHVFEGSLIIYCKWSGLLSINPLQKLYFGCYHPYNNPVYYWFESICKKHWMNSLLFCFKLWKAWRRSYKEVLSAYESLKCFRIELKSLQSKRINLDLASPTNDWKIILLNSLSEVNHFALLTQ